MADFDPHAFVADEGAAFDPHSFVADEEGGPESFLDPKKFKPSPQHRKLKNIGPDAGGQIQQAKRDAGKATEITAEGLVNAPAAAWNSIADSATFGGYGALLRAAQASRIPYVQDVAHNTLAGIDRHRSLTFDKSVPIVGGTSLSHLTDIPAYFMAPTEALAGTVERALPQATSLVGRVANSAVGSGATSAAIGGMEAMNEGADVPQIVQRAADAGTVGMVTGGAVAAPLTAAGASARAILGSRGAQAREFLTARGEPVGVRSAGRSGHINDADIGAAATQVDADIKAALQEYKQKTANGPYQAEVGKITPEQAGELVDVTPLYRNLQAASVDPANLQVADKLERLAKMLEHHKMTRPDGSEPMLMTQEQVNGLRQSLGGISGVGKSTAAKLSPLQDAFGQTKEIVDRGPFRDANAAYNKGIADVDESLDMLGLSRTNNPDEPIKGNLRVKAQRAGQNKVTAGADRAGFDAFREKHPDLALKLDEPEILRKSADLGFSVLPQSHGGLIDRTSSAVMMGSALDAMLHAANHGIGSPSQVAAAALLGLIAKNRAPIAGRLLYTPAQAVMRMEGGAFNEIPQIAAARAARGEQRP